MSSIRDRLGLGGSTKTSKIRKRRETYFPHGK